MNILEKMVDVLARIAQGKYVKSEFALTIQPHQEIVLRTLALETLIEMLKGLSKLVEDAEKERAIEENKLKEEAKNESDPENEKDNTSNVGEENISRIDAYDRLNYIYYFFLY